MNERESGPQRPCLVAWMMHAYLNHLDPLWAKAAKSYLTDFQSLHSKAKR
jgi:hypothetical protein